MPGCGKSEEVKARGSGRIPYGQVSASGREFGKGKRVVELADDELEPGLVEVSRLLYPRVSDVCVEHIHS